MNRAEEKTASLEILAALMISTGMLSMAILIVLGKALIITGIGTLILVYAFRLAHRSPKPFETGHSLAPVRLNYALLIVALILLSLLLFAARGKMLCLFSGLALMFSLALADLFICRKHADALNLAFCLLRISLVTMLLLLFYFFPVN